VISILESRGIDLDVLKLRGDLINRTYDDAKQEFKSFESFSKVAFVLYGLMLIFRIVTSLAKDNEVLQIAFVILFWISVVGYFIVLIKSFVNQARYYEMIGKKESQLNPFLYFTVGLIIYLVMYFVFRKQMRDEMNDIR
jgi:cell division protein FtsW (lipid II flippase)